VHQFLSNPEIRERRITDCFQVDLSALTQRTAGLDVCERDHAHGGRHAPASKAPDGFIGVPAVIKLRVRHATNVKPNPEASDSNGSQDSPLRGRGTSNPKIRVRE
jgi:hypothetical protein